MSPPTVEIRTDNAITTEGAEVTPEEARSLHAWAEAKPTDSPPTVAVMDSGIHEDTVNNHPWFEGVEVVKRFDATGTGNGSDNVGHGTGVASIIARNSPAVELVDVRIFGDSGRSDFPTIRKAYDWLIENADLVTFGNMSWGARRDVPQINQLHEKLVQKGVSDVVAAGNTGGEGGSPSTSPKAFSAGAVDIEGDLTRFTSRDPNQDNPDLAAIGKNVKMARAPGTSLGSPINDQFTVASGTSFSAPYTTSAKVTAWHRKRRSWDAAFEKAAPDIPGSKADGEGLLKLKPALKSRTPDEDNPSTGVTTMEMLGTDAVVLDDGFVPDGASVAELLSDGEGEATILFRQ